MPRMSFIQADLPSPWPGYPAPKFWRPNRYIIILKEKNTQLYDKKKKKQKVKLNVQTKTKDSV